jgi:hypothetical protein
MCYVSCQMHNDQTAYFVYDKQQPRYKGHKRGIAPCQSIHDATILPAEGVDPIVLMKKVYVQCMHAL